MATNPSPLDKIEAAGETFVVPENMPFDPGPRTKDEIAKMGPDGYAMYLAQKKRWEEHLKTEKANEKPGPKLVATPSDFHEIPMPEGTGEPIKMAPEDPDEVAKRETETLASDEQVNLAEHMREVARKEREKYAKN
jgi:hypothetical protein